MTMAFGGPNSYTGRSMAAAHKHLIEQKGLNASHFDKVAGHLVSTLQSLGVEKPLIDEVVAIVGPLRSIFEAPTADGKGLGATPKAAAAPAPQMMSKVRGDFLFVFFPSLSKDCPFVFPLSCCLFPIEYTFFRTPSSSWMMTLCSPVSGGRRLLKLPLTSSTRRSWPILSSLHSSTRPTWSSRSSTRSSS